MVLRAGSHSWPHLLRYVLGWETWMEANPSSNFCRWSSTLVRPTSGSCLLKRYGQEIRGRDLLMMVWFPTSRPRCILSEVKNMYPHWGCCWRHETIWFMCNNGKNMLCIKFPTLQIGEIEADSFLDKVVVFECWCFSWYWIACN